MGFESGTLNFIRGIISEPQKYNLPMAPQIANYATVGAYGAGGFGFMNNTYSQSVINYLAIDQDTVTRYVDYEDMGDSALCSTALEIYSDDATQVDPDENRTLWVTSSDETIRADLNDMLHSRMNLEEKIWLDAMTLCKYGNMFNEFVVKKDVGIVGVNPLPPPTMRRIEIGTGSEAIIGFIYDPTATFRMTTADFVQKLQHRIQDGGKNSSDYYTHADHSIVFEDWEMAHFRLRGKNPYSQYGYGIFESGRWIYKRLVLLEDSLVQYRISRSPSRFAFYVDVSNIPPNETSSYLNKVRQAVKQQKFANNQTGKQDLKFSPLSPSDDFFLPVRDGNPSTRVETLTGPVYDAIEDIKYFENKLFAALKVPKAFLTYEESTAKTNLSAEDTRFARTIMRIQRELKNGYKKACRVHLSAKGINPDKVDFELNMTIPSAIFELAQMEIRNAEIELAEKFGAFAPRGWILRNVLKFSDDQIEEMARMRKREEAEENGGESEEHHASSGNGSLDKAIASRHEEPASISAAGESRNYRLGNDEFFNGGIKRNMSTIVERLEEAKDRDKKFAQKWNRMTALVEDLRQNLRK